MIVRLLNKNTQNQLKALSWGCCLVEEVKLSLSARKTLENHKPSHMNATTSPNLTTAPIRLPQHPQRTLNDILPNHVLLPFIWIIPAYPRWDTSAQVQKQKPF